MRSKLLFILLIVFSYCYGQDDEVQLMKEKLKQKIPDTMRARIYSDLALSISDEDQWTYYNKKALDLANKKLPTVKGKERILYLTIKGHATGNLGYYYDEHGDVKKSLEHYFKAIELYEQAGDQAAKSNILSGIGVIFTNQKDYDEAFEYLNRSLELKLKYEPYDVSIIYLNIGAAYQGVGDSTQAINYYKKALESAEENKDFKGIAVASNNIGSYYYAHNSPEASFYYMKRAIENYKKAGDIAGEAFSTANLGGCFRNVNELDSAEYYMLKAKEISEKIDNPELTQNIVEHFYFLNVAKEDWQNALMNFRQAIKIRDSINGIDIQKSALKKKLEFEHKLETTKLQTKREEERKRSFQRTVFISVALVLILIIAIVMYSRYRTTKKQKGIIERQKFMVEEKNKEITDSINYAKYLQRAILPELQQFFSEFSDGFLTYLPKDIVAGDFYWKSVTKKFIYVAVADSTGHGVPGALVSVVCSNALDKAVQEDPEIKPGEMLNRTRDLVVAQFETEGSEVKDGMDIALIRIDKAGKEVLYSGANNPCWLRKNDKWEVLKGSRQPIGKFDHKQPFETLEVPYEKGDWIYSFSDGIIDQFGGEEMKKLKTKGLRDFLSGLDELSGCDRKERLESFFTQWKGEEDQIDDVCLIGIKL